MKQLMICLAALLNFSCQAQPPNLEGMWVTDVTQTTDPELYMELFFTKDSVSVNLPFLLDRIYSYHLDGDSALEINGLPYPMVFVDGEMFYSKIVGEKICMKKSPELEMGPEAYSERYYIAKLNNIDNLSQAEKETLLAQFRSGTLPKPDFGDLEEEIMMEGQ